MDLLQSMKWVILSQKLYRLAVFRIDKTGRKLVTDNWEIFASILFISIVSAEVIYIGQKVYFQPPGNFFQSIGESKFAGNKNCGRTIFSGKNSIEQYTPTWIRTLTFIFSKLLIFSLHFSITISTFCNNAYSDYLSDSKGFQLFSLIGYLEFTLTVINGMFFFFTAIFKRRKQIKFIEKIQKIDNTIVTKFGLYPDYSKYRNISLGILVAVIVYYNFIVAVAMYKYLLDIQSPSALATFAVYIMQSASSGIFTYGFVGYVILIGARLIRINAKLANIVRIPPEILEKQYKNKDVLCMEMMRFTKMYKNLCSCVEDLNQIYGSSMVLHFAHDFTLLTTQIFAMFYIGFFEDPTEKLSKILALMVWLLPNIIKMSFICFTCHMTRNEVRLSLRVSDVRRHFLGLWRWRHFWKETSVFEFRRKCGLGLDMMGNTSVNPIVSLQSPSPHTKVLVMSHPWWTEPPYSHENLLTFDSIPCHFLGRKLWLELEKIQQRSQRRWIGRFCGHVLAAIDSSEDGVFSQQLLLHRHVAVLHHNFSMHHLFSHFDSI